MRSCTCCLYSLKVYFLFQVSTHTGLYFKQFCTGVLAGVGDLHQWTSGPLFFFRLPSALFDGSGLLNQLCAAPGGPEPQPGERLVLKINSSSCHFIPVFFCPGQLLSFLSFHFQKTRADTVVLCKTDLFVEKIQKIMT